MTEKEPGTFDDTVRRDPAIDRHLEMLKLGSRCGSSDGCYDPLEDIDDPPPNPAAKGYIMFRRDGKGKFTVHFEDAEA